MKTLAKWTRAGLWATSLVIGIPMMILTNGSEKARRFWVSDGFYRNVDQINERLTRFIESR